MSCEEMQEWEQVEEEVEELIELQLPETPSKPALMEEIHEMSHELIALEQSLRSKARLNKGETAKLLLEAARRVIGKYRSSQPLVAIELPVLQRTHSH